MPALAALIALAACAQPSQPSPAPAPPPIVVDTAQPWLVADPAQAGMDRELLARAANDASRIPRFRGLLVARNGTPVMERYFGGAGPDTHFDVRSVTKSVVSTLVGIAVGEGRLASLDDTVGRYVGAPYTLDSGDSEVTVRQLLTMSAGYSWNDDLDYNPWIFSADHVQFLFDRPRSGPAGRFTYNSAAAHLLGVALQTATQTTLPDYAGEKLFRPIGVESARWEILDRGTVNGGSGIELTGRDLVRFGQLVLQQGRSGDRQVVPQGWTLEMTGPGYAWHQRYGAQSGVTYGYLWWVADAAPVPAYFAWGYGGQFVYIVPSKQLVVVTTTEWTGLGSDGSTNALALAESALGIIVNDVIPAAR
jgi:CubicO group peptidase (beta-lactamase class C family)